LFLPIFLQFKSLKWGIAWTIVDGIQSTLELPCSDCTEPQMAQFARVVAWHPTGSNLLRQFFFTSKRSCQSAPPCCGLTTLQKACNWKLTGNLPN
jgi:hypothetical protein